MSNQTQNTDSHELDNLKGERNYKGCLVSKIIGGYSIFGIKVVTPQEVDEIINNGCKAIEYGIEKGKSVTVTNGSGAISAQNDTDGTYVWER